jgi:type VI secretion system protein ImpB
MGDFSNGQTKGKVADRERININKDNFESVMEDLKPTTRFEVPNLLAKDGSDISVTLSFESMKDFRPDHVAQQVPELHSLMAMRNLLKDLKSNLLDNAKFRKELEKIVSNQPELEGLKAELEQLLEKSQETSDLEIRSY